MSGDIRTVYRARPTDTPGYARDFETKDARAAWASSTPSSYWFTTVRRVERASSGPTALEVRRLREQCEARTAECALLAASLRQADAEVERLQAVHVSDVAAIIAVIAEAVRASVEAAS